MYCDFYSFHDKVDFNLDYNYSNMAKFKNRFTIIYKGLSYTSYCKSFSHGLVQDNPSNVYYMIRSRTVNRSFKYKLVLKDCYWIFTLNSEFDSDFQKWLCQFPICIDLDYIN